MPGKHVHFADAVGPSTPSTPSPSYSVSSLPSSTGPFTPQSGSSISLPGGVYTVHPLLMYADHPVLWYDVSLQPGAIKLRDINLSVHVLAEPATQPPLPYMEIISPHHLPWRLIIRPVAQPRPQGMPVPSYITVADVLHGMYSSLRLPVLKTEYDLVPDKAMRMSIDDAYAYRCERIPDANLSMIEKQKGIKRVDFLTSHLFFHGLTSTKYGGHVWALSTSSS